MLKLYILCASACASACASDVAIETSKVHYLIGTWYSVEFFPSLYGDSANLSECEPHTLSSDPGTTYKCGGKPTESLTYTFSERTHASPIIFVNSHEEALAELNEEYTCEGTSEKPTVFQILDKDHFLSYVGKKLVAPFTFFRLLFARSIPSVSDLNVYVKTVDALKDLTGNIVCASDIQITHQQELRNKEPFNFQKEVFSPI